jgi:hypothetical protein
MKFDLWLSIIMLILHYRYQKLFIAHSYAMKCIFTYDVKHVAARFPSKYWTIISYFIKIVHFNLVFYSF